MYKKEQKGLDLETRREWCSRLLQDKNFLKSVDHTLPKIAVRAGVQYRWLIHLKNGTRTQMDSDLIDSIHQTLTDLVLRREPRNDLHTSGDPSGAATGSAGGAL